MTYFSSRHQRHTHKYFLDQNSQQLVCLCGKVKGKRELKRGFSKYHAKSTYYEGRRYDSRREAEYARDLDLLLKAGKIVEIERQYPVRVETEGVHLLTTKVDFRVKLPDGSYELHEVKGFETADYKLRRKLLELIWLPKHPDHVYIVIK